MVAAARIPGRFITTFGKTADRSDTDVNDEQSSSTIPQRVHGYCQRWYFLPTGTGILDLACVRIA